MTQQGGFMIECKTSEDAKHVYACAREYLSNQNLEDPDWAECMELDGQTVGIDYECGIDWMDFDGLFASMCEYIEDKLPGLMQSGDARYANLSVGFEYTAELTRDGNGIRITDESSEDEE